MTAISLAIVVVVGTVLGGRALASDMFGDIPSTMPQHDAIHRVVNAGIMRPCTAGTPPNFCPNDAVFRAQQASQWDRALGLNGTVATNTYVDKSSRLVGAAVVTQGFEGVTFPPAGWTTGGTAPWTRDTTTFVEGSASAASGSIGNGQSTFIDIDQTLATTVRLTFRWKVSSQDVDDFLLFCVDNDACTPFVGYSRRITGSVNWTLVDIPVAAGTHSFRWVYTKDPICCIDGSDKGWLDDVRFTRLATVEGDLTVQGSLAIGLSVPATQKLHIEVGAQQGQGMEIDSAVAGHSPAIYLNHTGTAGNNYRIASYGDNFNPGSFRIRQEGVGDRFVIDDDGNVSITAGLRAEVGTGKKFSLGGNGSFEIDKPGIGAGRFVITDSGDVGIGQNTPTNILQVQQNSTTDPIADAWTVYSSRRWKTNIETIENALDIVQRLRGVRYESIGTGRHDIGLVAEEVAQVVPEVVAFEANGTDAKSVDYARLVALLIESTKAQQAQIEALQIRIAVLEKSLIQSSSR